MANAKKAVGKKDPTMTEEELVKALVQYRLLEEQKKLFEEQQKALKNRIKAHMVAGKLEQVEGNGVTAQFVPRPTYVFDIPSILGALPEAVGYLKLNNEDFEVLMKGNEEKIGGFRTTDMSAKTLTIRGKAPESGKKD